MAAITDDVWFAWQCVQTLEKELGIESLRTMKRIKAALDPTNIMNPNSSVDIQM
jgi:FAD/FMN-containing dehydrogenase